jgi:hypothetical protein
MKEKHLCLVLNALLDCDSAIVQAWIAAHLSCIGIIGVIGLYAIHLIINHERHKK